MSTEYVMKRNIHIDSVTQKSTLTSEEPNQTSNIKSKKKIIKSISKRSNSKDNMTLADMLASRGTKMTSTKKNDNSEVFKNNKVYKRPNQKSKRPICRYSASEMGLPVVDLSQSNTLKELDNYGITNFIPLPKMVIENNNFAIPIISIQNVSLENGKSLLSLHPDGILTLGSIKTLPKP